MYIKKLLLALSLSFLICLPSMAQSSMTDKQIMQFMVTENARGTSRSQIVTKLIERGVTIDQIRRVREKYEKQKSVKVIGFHTLCILWF